MYEQEHPKPWPIFLKTKELNAFTGLPAKSVRAILAQRGVKPVDTGGKHYCLRWHRDAVKAVMDTLYAEAQEQPCCKVKRTPGKTLTVSGKSAGDLFAELSA